MKPKTRTTCLILAFLATLCLAPVATAQSETAPVSATLVDNFCAFDITSTKGELGIWTYDPTSNTYQLTSDLSTVTVLGTLLKIPAVGCNLLIEFSGLTGPGGGIDTTHFSALDAAGVSRGPSGWAVSGWTEATYSFQLTLDSVPILAAGSYSGEVEVTVVRAA